MSAILERSVIALNALDAKYVIIMPNGTKYERGGLKLEPERTESNKIRRKRGLVHPIGAVKQYYWPLIKDVTPGQLVEVPYDKFGGEILASGISSYATRIWGKQSAMTVRNNNKGVVEVLRLK